MTAIPESSYKDFEGYVDLDDFPVYALCEYCGWDNLEDAHYCAYCAEDWCPELDTCIECNLGWIQQAYPDLEVL